MSQTIAYLNRCEPITVEVTSRIIGKTEGLVEILTLGAEASVITADGERIVGRINFKLLVSDSENNIVPLNYNADFIENNNASFATAEIKDISAEIQSGNEILATAVVELTPFECVSSSFEVSPITDMITLSKEITLCNAQCFRTTLNILNEEEVNAEKILQADAKAVINRASFSEETLTAEGTVYLSLIYLNGEGLPVSLKVPIAFSEDSPIKTDCVGQALAIPDGISVRVRLDENEENTVTMSAEISLSVLAVCFNERTVVAPIDAFSLTHEAILETQAIKGTCYMGRINEAIPFNASVEVSNLSRIVGAFNVNARVVSVTQDGLTANLDAVIKGNLLYLDNEDKLATFSFELPFYTDLASSEEACGRHCVSLAVTDITARKNGASADFSGTIEINGALLCDKTARIVIAASKGEAKANDYCAIEAVLVNKGESLWDISKTLNMSSTDLLAMNPELTDPTEKPVRIVVYRQA